MIPRLKGCNALMRILLACAMLCLALAYPAYTATEQKVALVIGNSTYPTARLRNPVNDAKAMADKLKALGFDVILKTDVNLREMTRSFSQFGQRLVPGSVGLFYYAGHGVQVQGKNFLIPVDAEIESEASVRTEAVDVDQLLHQLGAARLSMVILDACRNNPFERRFRGSSGGLAQIDAPTGTLLAYATAPGKVASDGTGSNGLYTEALLKALDMPGLKVEDVFKQVRINVVKASDGQQTPWESSSLTGEFYFVPDNKVPVAEEKLKQSEKERLELAKALEEERKKRDKDAELVRAEMEKLRAELLKIRTDAAAAAPVTPTVAIGSATQTTSSKPPASQPQPPQQVAVATPPPSPPAVAPAASVSPPAIAVGSGSASTVSKPTDTQSEQRPTQVAIVAPSPTITTIPPASSAEWAERFALLEKFRGQLIFSKAVAILLDLSAAEELTLLLTYERELKGMKWPSAYAMGTDKKGNFIWGGSYGGPLLIHVSESALEYCARATGDSCTVVMLNGEFREKDFLGMAKRLGEQNVAAVREAYVQSLRKNPPSFIALTSKGGTVAWGFTSFRE